MAKEKGGGFQASAGLIRYFDAEEKSAFRIHPWVVITLSIVTGTVIMLLKKFYPL